MPNLQKTFGYLFVATSIFALGACSDDSGKKQAQKPIPVTTMTMASSSQPYMVDVFGQTEGDKAVNVYPQVTGPIISRHYTEGYPVKKGDLLFTIDPKPFEAAYQSAKASTEQAEVDLKQAQREAIRYTNLHKAKAVSEKEYTDAVSAFESAKANLAACQAKEQEAKITLDYTSVRSPVDGIAGRALVNPGALVSANSTQLTDVTQDKDLKVRFSISDNDLHGYQITEDSPVIVIADKIKDPINAKMNFTATQIDPKTGTRSLSAQLDRKADILPGQYVTVRLTLGKQDNVFLVPQKAIRQLSDGTYSVYIFADNQAKQRAVTVGRWLGSDWIVTGGLKNGDEVIIDQIQRLKDKASVIKNTDKKTTEGTKK